VIIAVCLLLAFRLAGKSIYLLVSWPPADPVPPAQSSAARAVIRRPRGHPPGGSDGARNAATRRATRVARNTWPVSASITAIARPPLPPAVKSP